MANVERLGFIQTVIDRMARNSFALKGWSVTVIAAVIGLADKADATRFTLVGIYAIVAFLCLDAYYLALERKFRALYDAASSEPDDVWSLDPGEWQARDLLTLLSPSVVLLYGLELVAVIGFAATRG